MTRIGRRIVVVGVLLTVGGWMLFFSLAFMQAMQAQQVASRPIAVGEELTTDLIEVETEQLCQIALQVDLRTESVQEDEFSFPDEEAAFKARYKFPFRYSVLDLGGDTVYSGTNLFSWDNSRTKTFFAEDLDAAGGTLSVEHRYDKFKVAPPGQINIRIEFSPDETYHAEAQKVLLNVYDQVSGFGTSGIGGIAMTWVGPILILSGIIVRSLGRRRSTQPRNDEPPSPSVTRESMG